MKKLILIFFFPISLLASEYNDSLQQIWNNRKNNDTVRLQAMNLIAWNYVFTQPDSCIYFANKQLELATIGKHEKYIANAFGEIGKAYYKKGIYDSSLYYYNKCLDIRKALNDKLGEAWINYGLADILIDQGNYREAIKLYHKNLNFYEEIDDSSSIARTYQKIGMTHSKIGDNINSLKYFQLTKSIYQKLNNKNGLAYSFLAIGNVKNDLKQYQDALTDYNQSLNLFIEINNKDGIANSFHNIGNVHRDTENFREAEINYFKSLKIFEEIGDRYSISMNLNNIANLYFVQKNYTEAIKYGTLALSEAKKYDGKWQIKYASDILYKAYKSTNNYKKSLEMHEILMQTSNILKNDSNIREVYNQKYKYEYEKKATADSIKSEEEKKVQSALLTAEKAENSKRKLQTKYLLGGLGLVIVFGLFIYNRFKLTKKQKIIIEGQKQKVDEAFEELEEKNKEILDSIHYAKRIQAAVLPPLKIVKEYLQNSFILYKPKDIVAGDFYWIEHKDNKVLFAACDCTGHGVPGAMVSVVCVNGLNRSVREHGLTDPGKILDKTREIVIDEFEKSEDEVKDGMDLALCSLEGNKLQYAGANNPLWVIRKGSFEVKEIKATKEPIGKFEHPHPYTTHTLELQKGDSIYIFSDGYVDQFGGEKGKKYKTGKLKKFLLSIQEYSMEKQRELLNEEFESWRGSIEQIDDVCVIGVRI